MRSQQTRSAWSRQFLFFRPAFFMALHWPRFRGQGPASLLKRYGQRKRSIYSESRLGTAWGLFSEGRISFRDGGTDAVGGPTREPRNGFVVLSPPLS
jgi:hypothetical protein